MNVLYFKHRLQASEFATNFAGTLLFALGFDLSPEPGVFYGRMLKAIVMASVPCLCFVLMQLRFDYSKWVSLWCSLAVGLVPGLYFFYGLGIDIGLEIPFGLAALILAGSQRLWVVGMAGVLLMFSALCYGAGLAFGPAVAWFLIRHPDWKRRGGECRWLLWVAWWWLALRWCTGRMYSCCLLVEAGQARLRRGSRSF